MRVEPGERATDGRGVSGWARVRLLPRPVLLAGALILLSTLIPAATGLVAALPPSGGGRLAALRGNLALAGGLSLALALGALLLVERPRRGSPAAYLRQLRARWDSIEAELDGDVRRRSGGEVEDRHVPEAHPLAYTLSVASSSGPHPRRP